MYRRLIPCGKGLARCIASTSNLSIQKRAVPEICCVQCFSNQSDRGKRETKQHRCLKYAAIATSSLAAVYMFLHSEDRTNSNTITSFLESALNKTAYLKSKHVQSDDTPLSDTREETDNETEAEGGLFPFHVKYLIVGAGTASVYAYRAIKAKDPRAKILVVGEETFVPYKRSPLSKSLWFADKELAQSYRYDKTRDSSIFFEPRQFYLDPVKLSSMKNGGVGLILGKKVVKLDVQNKRALLDDGREIVYEKCLLATGAKPKQHPVLEAASQEVKDRTIMFKNTTDFSQLNETCDSGKSVAILGGGFLASELACALGLKGTEVYQIIPETGNLGSLVPEYLSKYVTSKVQGVGVNVMSNQTVEAADYNGSQVELTLQDGKKVMVDQVVVAGGQEPNVDLAKTSDLDIDKSIGGFRVNAELEARSDVWVAGDACCFYDMKLGQRRVEHQDHAMETGKLAGENMTGTSKPYCYQSFYWSIMEPYLIFFASGIVDSNLQTYAVFEKPIRKKKRRSKLKIKSPEDPKPSTGTSSKNSKISQNEQSSRISQEKTNETNEGQSQKTVSSETSRDVSVTGPVLSNQREKFNKGVVFYLRDGAVVGMLMVNLPSRKIDIARQVINDGCRNTDLHEVSKLFLMNPIKTED